jgi:hypothetical protein
MLSFERMFRYLLAIAICFRIYSASSLNLS